MLYTYDLIPLTRPKPKAATLAANLHGCNVFVQL